MVSSIDDTHDRDLFFSVMCVAARRACAALNLNSCAAVSRGV